MGTQELLILLLIVVILFGATKIPKLARSLGEGIKEFRKSVKNGVEGEEELLLVAVLDNEDCVEED